MSSWSGTSRRKVEAARVADSNWSTGEARDGLELGPGLGPDIGPD